MVRITVKPARRRMTKYTAKIRGTTMKVRETAYDYLCSESDRRKRTPQGQMELMIEMFKMIIDEFQNDDVDIVRAEIRKLRALADKKNRG